MPASLRRKPDISTPVKVRVRYAPGRGWVYSSSRFYWHTARTLTILAPMVALPGGQLEGHGTVSRLKNGAVVITA